MAKKTNNDQDRLGQVEQTDLNESRVNEEFVDWLKKWGNGILLAVLLAAWESWQPSSSLAGGGSAKGSS